MSAPEWKEALDRIYLIAEIDDSRYEHYQFELPDIIADNNAIAAVIWDTDQSLAFSQFSRELNVCIKTTVKRSKKDRPEA